MCRPAMGVVSPVDVKKAHNAHIELTLSERISSITAVHYLTLAPFQKVSVPMPLCSDLFHEMQIYCAEATP